MSRVSLCLILVWTFPALAVAEPREEPADAGPDGAVSFTEREAERLLDQAERLWRDNQPGAWLVWMSVPLDTVAGREARRRLEQAAEHYREALDLLQQGDDELALVEIDRGRSIAPIDPHLYLDLADILRNRGRRDLAVRYYGRYLVFINQAGETADPEVLQDIRIYISGDPADDGRIVIEEPDEPEEESPWATALFIGAVLGLLVIFGVVVLLRRGRTLTELVDESPDLHPRIAYAIGCLRHELLKHRLGALGEAVGALREGRGLSPEQRRYLREKLYGGESLSRLWRIYLETFDRLSGWRLNLKRRDREFRRAGQAVRALEGLQERFEVPDGGLADRLDGLRLQIARFDRYLKAVADRLCRSKVDGQLLREAVFSVQSEPRAAEVGLDEIRFVEPPPDLYVEVFRTDLLIVLRNLVRNAILALGQQREGPRALGLEVELRTEPTGDESVLIKVMDTSPERVTTDDIYGRRLDHGLGLVAAAVTRYDGSIFVESGAGTWKKAVVVRFFRALGEQS